MIGETSEPTTEAPFKYVGGDPSLDLVNTVDWTPNGLTNDKLTDYDRVTRWAEGAGIVTAVEAERLRKTARERPEAAARACLEVRRLRTLLQRLYRSIAVGEETSAWKELDAELAAALSHLRVTPTRSARGESRVATWEWRGWSECLESVLWPVVWGAAELLTSAEASRIQICDGPDCGWMFVDRSRNRLRRWCQMETCGTAAKSRRRRERNQPAGDRM